MPEHRPRTDNTHKCAARAAPVERHDCTPSPDELVGRHSRCCSLLLLLLLLELEAPVEGNNLWIGTYLVHAKRE
eukprot:6848782-Prymnesium_polylepis.1